MVLKTKIVLSVGMAFLLVICLDKSVFCATVDAGRTNTFLLPQAITLDNEGTSYLVYPSSLQYVYSNSPVFPDIASFKDGNEEDVYFAKKDAEERSRRQALMLVQALKEKEKEQEREKERLAASSRAEKEAALSPKKPVIHTSIDKTVLFVFDSAIISHAEKVKLQERMPEFNAAVGIEIKGYTDKRGGAKYNEGLALKRAMSVKQLLVRWGIAANKIEIEAHGKCCYISDSDRKNRRTEIWVSEK